MKEDFHMPRNLGLHESLELHELLTFKNTCLTKSTTMGTLAQDAVLQEILNQDAAQSREAVEALRSLLAQQGGNLL
jgi:similar to spore coat protein